MIAFLATVVLAVLSTPASSQESLGDLGRETTSEFRGGFAPGGFFSGPDTQLPREFDSDASLARSPRFYFADPPTVEGPESQFSIGPAAGYIRTRGADNGTWFGGVQARLHFAKIFAAEAAITFHSNHYESGDVVVTQYPLQLTAFLYPIPEGPVRPYILGGVGWYYTRIDYKASFGTISDRTEHFFGEHLGAGVEFMLGTRTSFDVDFRYIFINASNEQVIRREFNYAQITLGLNFFF